MAFPTAKQSLVPDLTGVSKAVAVSTLTACGLVQADGTGTNTKAIASQSIAPGTPTNLNTTVTVNYGSLTPVAQTRNVLPTIVATTPTGNYNQWALLSLTIAPADQKLSDKFTIQTPYAITAVLQKGYFTPDGYWEASPTDALVTLSNTDILHLAQQDTTFAALIETVAGYIGTVLKAFGLV